MYVWALVSQAANKDLRLGLVLVGLEADVTVAESNPGKGLRSRTRAQQVPIEPRATLVQTYRFHPPPNPFPCRPVRNKRSDPLQFICHLVYMFLHMEIVTSSLCCL